MRNRRAQAEGGVIRIGSNPKPSSEVVEPSTVLGDWYANLLHGGVNDRPRQTGPLVGSGPTRRLITTSVAPIWPQRQAVHW